MKHTLYLVLSALTAGLLGCSTPAPAPGTATASHAEISYIVYGMDCPGCHGGLEKNLEKIPGVMDASANWKQQTVSLRLAESDTVTAEQVKQAVEDSNFTLGQPVL